MWPVCWVVSPAVRWNNRDDIGCITVSSRTSWQSNCNSGHQHITPTSVICWSKGHKRITASPQAAELTSTVYKATTWASTPANVKRSDARKLLVKETGNKRSYATSNVKQKKPTAKRQKKEKFNWWHTGTMFYMSKKYKEQPLEEWQQYRLLVCGPEILEQPR